jgi:alpha-tubulin suppressor-like RCC1 family protein
VAAVTVVPPLQTLTITLAGEGTGTVTSTPTGLTCSALTCTGAFPFGTTVTVTPVPAAGSALDAWSGACTGTAACTVTMGQAQAITARFRRLPVNVASVTVSPAVVTIDEEGIATLTATARDAAGNVLTGRTVTWRSSDTTLAAVSASGVVSGRAEGDTVMITATVDSVRGTARVAVRSLFLLASEVTAGLYTSCAVRVSGGTYCWGDQPLGSASGQTGGARNLVDNSASFTSVNLGSDHGCALTREGQVRCWGSNAEGQLGIGTTVATQVSPGLVVGGQQFTRVFSGTYKSCGLNGTGRAFCWGTNFYGELGVSSSELRVRQPTAVSGDQRFAFLSPGNFHSCGIDVNGAALCWGNQGIGSLNRGALGDGSGTPKSAPTLVAGSRSWISIAVGDAHTCGIDRDGIAWCWGRNVESQLGTGGSNPTLVPERVLGATRYTAVTAGNAFTCALATTGQIFCWGNNGEGQLGNGTTTRSNQPVLVDAGATRFRSVAAGSYHVCAIDTTRRVHCWGWSSWGQTGRRSAGNDTRPVLVGRP